MSTESDKTERRGDGLIATNRKARHDFTVLETYACGIVLLGSEVKSLRDKHVSINEAFARTDGGELVLYGMHINPYPFSHVSIDPDRPRKLLAHKRDTRNGSCDRRTRYHHLAFAFRFRARHGQGHSGNCTR